MYSKYCNFFFASSVMGATLLGMGCAADVSRGDISAGYQGTASYATEGMSAEKKRYDTHLVPLAPSLNAIPLNNSLNSNVHQAKAIELARSAGDSSALGSVNLVF